MAEDMQTPETGEEGDTFGTDTPDRISQLESDLAGERSRALRVMADFQNYQRRAVQNEAVAKLQGVASLAYGVVGVVDHFDLALSQVPQSSSAEQIMTGIKVIREELLKVLQNNGVTMISPEKGELFVPGRHEAVMQQPSDDVSPGHVVSTFQPGYILAGRDAVPERVLRPAKVAVSPTE